MNFNVMVVFDIIIGILGGYLFVKGIICSKKHEVDPMLINAEELVRCKDVQGLSGYLMPKSAMFGCFCVLFAIEGVCNDLKLVAIPAVVNTCFLLGFVAAWCVFSVCIKRAKERFIQ